MEPSHWTCADSLSRSIFGFGLLCILLLLTEHTLKLQSAVYMLDVIISIISNFIKRPNACALGNKLTKSRTV